MIFFFSLPFDKEERFETPCRVSRLNGKVRASRTNSASAVVFENQPVCKWSLKSRQSRSLKSVQAADRSVARPLLIELIIGLSLPLTFGNRFKPLLPPLVDPRKLNMAEKEEENKFIDRNSILFLRQNRPTMCYFINVLSRINFISKNSWQKKGKKVSFLVKFRVSSLKKKKRIFLMGSWWRREK